MSGLVRDDSPFPRDARRAILKGIYSHNYRQVLNCSTPHRNNFTQHRSALYALQQTVNFNITQYS